MILDDFRKMLVGPDLTESDYNFRLFHRRREGMWHSIIQWPELSEFMPRVLGEWVKGAGAPNQKGELVLPLNPHLRLSTVRPLKLWLWKKHRVKATSLGQDGKGWCVLVSGYPLKKLKKILYEQSNQEGAAAETGRRTEG